MSARRVVDNGLTTAIAVDKDKHSQNALKWALENIVADYTHCVLLHVQPKGIFLLFNYLSSYQNKKCHKTLIRSCFAEGNIGPRLQRDIQDKEHPFFLPFRGFCARKGIMAKEVVLRDSDISNAIVNYITNNSISNIVVGSSAHKSFFKKFKSPDVATTLLKTAPETCAVFVVSKAKLLKSKSASQSQRHRYRQQDLSSLLYNYDSMSSSDSERGSSVSAQYNNSSAYSSRSYSPCISPPQSLSEFSQSDTYYSSYGMVSAVTPYTISEGSTTKGSSISSTSTNQHLEAEDQELQLPRANETRELPRSLSEEKQTEYSDIQADEMAKHLVKMQSQKRRLLELQAKLGKQKMTNNVSYRRYSTQDVEEATNGFSDALKIGEGGYGPVYKAVLDHTPVAIKILRSGITQGLKQFQQEVEVLSSMRHPNMVILLGACPDYGCLVYEYMENGTLEDRLFCKDNTPPLSWRARFRIAAEIATGLLFLHSAKPEPLVHRDLKPANILLDRYFTSKISDVGLAHLVPPCGGANSFSNYHITTAAGTFCYIDPEYQQTGMLGVKSDLYSFGVVLLQIITAMPAMGLGHRVQMAVENNNLSEVLDPKVSDWPEEETLELAKLALKCCEMRKKDRPDLVSVLLPALKRLREFAGEENEGIQDRT
ncbi:Protein kinase superfamily protein [Raphanus sativus]|nr:Protein kinase superfamily protein [Raphanus sativus]